VEVLPHRRVDSQFVQRALPVVVERDAVRRPHAFADLQGGAQSLGVGVNRVRGVIVERTVQKLVLVDEIAVQACGHPQLQRGIEGVVGHRA